MGSEGRQFC